MAGKLKQLLSRPLDVPPIITITGEQGVGKTTLATLFPRPVYLPFENGLAAVPINRRPFAFPMCYTLKQGLGYVQTLIDEPHTFETLVVDSTSQLAKIIEAGVIASDVRKPKSINTAFGGYGAGLNACASWHNKFADKCYELHTKKRMAIVYIAHSRVETIEPPDGVDPYTRYTLRLDQRAATPYIDPADMVAFVRVHTKFVTKESTERVRAVSDKNRVIITYPTGAHISKNRYGIEEPIAWPAATRTVNPLLPFIPFYATE